MVKKIIGITGEMVGGKTLAASYLIDKYGAEAYRFSTILRDVTDRLQIEQNRNNLANLSTLLRKQFGEDLLAKVVSQDVKKANANLIVIDGVRRLSDIKYLQDLSEFTLVYIDADIKTRYNRVIKRNENVDDKTKTFDEFVENNKAEAEQEIPLLKKRAREIIINEDSLGSFYDKLDKLIK